MRACTVDFRHSNESLVKALVLALFIHIVVFINLDVRISELNSPRQSLKIELASIQSKDVHVIGEAGGNSHIEQEPNPTNIEPPKSSEFAKIRDPQSVVIPNDRQIQIKSTTAPKTFYNKAAEAASFDKKLEKMGPLNTKSRFDPTLNYYIDGILRKMQRIGSLNYPIEAQQKKLYGNLKFLVILRSDGTLKEARIIESSGHPVLDAATLSIIQKGSPYPPFPPGYESGKQTLEIIKTWEYKRS